ATCVSGLYDVRDLLGAAYPAFADHVAHYFEYCREHDCSIGTIFSAPLHHRHHPVSAQEPLRVVARHPDGIIVRGAKGVGTQAPYANELFCMTPPRPDLTREESVYFAAPVNAEGIHVICREPLASSNPADHPARPSCAEM